MSDQVPDTLTGEIPQAMSIHTRKITDSCRDKDCIEDLQVYLTRGSQAVLNEAAGARVRSAELLHADIRVEPVAFDHHHYCIDVTFYYSILADAMNGSCRPAVICGLAVFSKRAVLCGEDSRAHIFRSDGCGCGSHTHRNTQSPTAVVEIAAPNQSCTTIATLPYIQDLTFDIPLFFAIMYLVSNRPGGSFVIKQEKIRVLFFSPMPI